MNDPRRIEAVRADARALNLAIARMALQFFLSGFIGLSAVMIVLFGIFGG